MDEVIIKTEEPAGGVPPAPIIEAGDVTVTVITPEPDPITEPAPVSELVVLMEICTRIMAALEALAMSVKTVCDNIEEEEEEIEVSELPPVIIDVEPDKTKRAPEITKGRIKL